MNEYEKRVLVILVSILLLLTLVLIIISLQILSFASPDTVPQTKSQICRQVSIPYTITETYYEQVPITRRDCYEDHLDYRVYHDTSRTNSITSCHITIKNLDYSKSGEWTVRFDFYHNGETTSKYDSAYIDSRETKEFKASVWETDASCSARVIKVPLKRFCNKQGDYEQVPKQRQIIKYASYQDCN